MRPAAVLALLLLASLTTLPGSSAVTFNQGKALNLNACDAAILDVQTDWDVNALQGLLPGDGPTISEAMAIWGVQSIHEACADPTSLVPPVGGGGGGGPGGPPTPPDDVVDALVANVLDAADKKPKLRCTGGGMTLVGWNDEIVLLGHQYSILRGPASSYWKLYTIDGKFASPVGHTRSLLDNIEGITPVDPGFLWEFAGIPMMQDYQSWNIGCTPPVGDIPGLITHVSLRLEGSPLGLGGSILFIRTEGTTCFAPC